VTEGSSGTEIHVVLGFDQNYWAPAYATMRSVCLHTRRRADLVFHLLERGVTAEQKAFLERIPAEFGATLRWYDLDDTPVFTEQLPHLPTNRRLSKVVFARLMIDRLLDPSIARVLYLDSDTMMRAPVETLYDIDLEGHPIAAVRDPYGEMIVAWRDLKANRDLFDIADGYFNSGVMLIDMAGWRESGVLDRLVAAAADGTLAKLYFDQDILNLVFKRRWLQLPATWNMVDPRRIHATLNPAIVHYTGRDRPWHMFGHPVFARIYRHTMTNEVFYRFMRERWRRRWRRLIGRR
jgi:lipopolysaccharide biosynthesis glycosyltransferase